MITVPQLDDVTVIDDTDDIMVTHTDGTTEKISGANMKADIVKNKIENNNGNAVSVNAVSTIMASSTTITGPELGTGGNIKILFTADVTGSDDTTGLSITYNGSAKAVKVGKDGSLVDFVASEISAGTYKYLQAYTTLELVYNGTYFIIVGNPIVLSDTDYTIWANGLKRVDSVASGDKGMVTSDAVYDFPIDSITSGQSRPVTSNAVDAALKPTIYNSGADAVAKTGTDIIRKISNLPKGIYLVTYGFGYLSVQTDYFEFYTTDTGGTISTTIFTLVNGWANCEKSCIMYLPNGGDVGMRGYANTSRFTEQANGKGLSAIKIGNV